ncbi:MAG: phage tail protein [Acidobacteria bacterium]|nr:phage tail protein [Acidobacteriota bacterium]
MAVSTTNTDILTASLGRPIVLAYGRHLVGGNVILKDETDADHTILFIALGEGEWDSVEELYLNEKLLTEIEDFHFHPGVDGQLSSNGTLDPEGLTGDQKVDMLTPPGVQGLTFSRTAYIALNAPFDVFAPGPEQIVRGIFKTRKVRFFNAGGAQTGTGYSDNPAWQIADLLTVVRGLSDSRIDWASFVAAAADCDALITIDGEQVKRFVSHVAFTEEVDFDQALQAILATCRGHLLDTEGTVKLRIDQARTSIFDFDMNNIIDGTFSAWWKDTRAVANRLELSFRDLDNDFAVTTKLWNHEPQQARTGRVIAARLHLGNVVQHQAERIGNYLLTRAIDNNLFCRFRSTQAGFAVMPGDVVRVKHDAAPWGTSPGDTLFETFEVLEVTEYPDETRELLCRLYNANTYPDTAGPAQNLVGTTVRRRPPVPEKPPLWNLSTDLGGNLRLSFAIPKNADYRTGDLILLADEELARITTTLSAPYFPGDTTIAVNGSAGFRVGDFISIDAEVLKLLGPGVENVEPTSNTWEVARAQKLTQEDLAGTNAPVYRLTELRQHFALPPGFTLAHPTLDLANGPHHVIHFRPGRLRILHAALELTGLGGISEPLEQTFALFGAFEPFVFGTLPGLRPSAGGLATIQIPGPLATGEDLAMPLVLPPETSIGLIAARVARTPQGQQIQFQVKIDGAVYGPTGVIPIQNQGLASGTGSFISGSRKGNVGGSEISVNLTQVGTTDPGEDFTLSVWF